MVVDEWKNIQTYEGQRDWIRKVAREEMESAILGSSTYWLTVLIIPISISLISMYVFHKKFSKG